MVYSLKSLASSFKSKSPLNSLDHFFKIIQHMIELNDAELSAFRAGLVTRTITKRAILSQADTIPQEIYFIHRGIMRVMLTDHAGKEHSIHFASEGQFIADYSCFMQQKPSNYALEALEEMEVIVLSRATIYWGYKHLRDGEKLGRLIAEYYFIYQDERIKNLYIRTPKQRYDAINHVFPGIHQRVPQHMIASYLGMSPIHLSRLKKMEKV